MQFPKEFLWGTATASYQIEGAAQEDGRGESIWDRFCRTPGKVANGDTGDVACDHYHRYEADVDLMAELGFQTYRFSMAWPRLFPTGEGRLNQKGIDFYKRLVEKLRARSIIPAVTLYHWDLPQALEEKGGWANRDTAYRFQEYAAEAYRQLGDSISYWITLNEPWCSAFLGHAIGHHAPGHTDWPLAVRTSHHLMLGHGLAVQAFREIIGAKAQIGITLNLAPVYAATDSPEDRAAAYRLDGYQNRWFLDPVFRGEYPDDMLASYTALAGAPLDYIRPEDLPVIGSPIDFLGINYYSRARVRANGESGFFGLDGLPADAPLTDMGWEIVPDCLYDLLVRIKADYGDLPLYITENGAAFPDQVDATGAVADVERVEFLRGHFAAAHRAIESGVNLKGYYVWSFMDNFEWAFGYDKRFGIVYCDYATQKRIPKRSALWYRDLIRERRL